MNQFRRSTNAIAAALLTAAIQPMAGAQVLATPPAKQLPGATAATSQTDLEMLYEQRGFCAAQREAAARLRCYEKLTADLLTSLSASSRQILTPTPPTPTPPLPAKTAQEVDSERIAQINKAWGGVFRAFTAMEASIGAGVSYTQYGPLLQAAATELALASQEAKSEASKAAATQFEIAVDAYRDAATWWERDISFYSRRDNNLAYAGGLPFSQVGLDSLVRKWSLPTRNADLLGFHRGVPRNTALQTMWAAASRATDTARKALLAPPTPPIGADVILKS